MPGRSYTGNGYRYGFNGKERDDEVSGNGNQYDYGFRIYNPRLGKFLSVDPLTRSYPFLTPYQFASNTPIMAIDLDGLEAYVVYLDFYEGKKDPVINIVYDENLMPGSGDFYMVHRNFTSEGHLQSISIGTGNYNEYPNYFTKGITYDYKGFSIPFKGKFIGGTLALKEGFISKPLGGSVGIDATLIGVEGNLVNTQEGGGNVDFLHPGNQETVEPHVELTSPVAGAKISTKMNTYDLSTKGTTAEFSLGPVEMTNGEPNKLTIGAEFNFKFAIGLGVDFEGGFQWNYESRETCYPNPAYNNEKVKITPDKKSTPDLNATF